jgi:hypothetical protein
VATLEWRHLCRRSGLLAWAAAAALSACGADDAPAEPPAAVQPWLPPASGEAAGGAPAADFGALLKRLPASDAPEITQRIDELVAEASQGMPENAGEAEVALRFAWFMHAHFANADPVPETVVNMLRERTAICGGTNVIYQLMLARVGIATRSVAIFSIPVQGNHSTAEVYWDGAWHYVDPTYGAYFTADGALAGAPLAWADIEAYRDFVAPDANYAVSYGRLGTAYTEAPPGPGYLDRFGTAQTNMLTAGNYDQFLPAMNAAAVQAGDAALTTTYAVDLGAQPLFALGTTDASSEDVARHLNAAGVMDANGMFFLGDTSSAAGPLYARHTYTITGLRPGDEVSWEGGLVTGKPEDIRVRARKARILDQSLTATAVTVRLKAKRESLELRVYTSDEVVIRFDYHVWRKR